MSHEDRMRRMRSAFIRLAAGVALIDLLGMAVWFFGGVRDADERTQRIVTGVWLVLTLIVVLPNLRAIRRARNEIR